MKKYSIKWYKAFVFVLIILLPVTINISAYSKTLIPCGMTVGISVRTKGVCVVDAVKFINKDGKSVSPAKDAGLKSGDYIIKINNKPVLSSEDLSSVTSEADKSIMVVVLRNGEEQTFEILPEEAKEGGFKLGVWVKEFESGLGTVTYIDPDTKEFGALGHGICHAENILTDIDGGSVIDIALTSIKKGERGAPGELVGIFSEKNELLGEVLKNTCTGVYGISANELLDNLNKAPVDVAERSSVKEGEAKILSNIEGRDVKEYSAKITKINDDETNTKGMIVKITDKELLQKTGGIVQGMSGSPIIQNGKLIGAVTHVFVNDPTRGYGIFIENMLAEAEKME